MSLFRRFISIPLTLILGILLAIAVMFMLFVYPNPPGFYFSLLKVFLIGAVGYLFFHLYSAKKEKEKHRQVRASLPLFKRGEEIEEIRLQKEEEIAFEKSMHTILELFTDSFPEFSISAYLIDHSEVELLQRSYCGIRNAFRKSIPLDNTRMKDLFRSDQPQFLTPDAGEDIFSFLFEESSKILPSTTVLVAPITVEGINKGIILIEAEQFSDFEESHREIALSYAKLLAAELTQFESRSSLRSDNLFYTHLEAFQNDLDIDRSEDEMLASLTRFCGSNFSFDKLTVSLKHENHPDEAVVRAVSGFTMDIGPGKRFPLQGSLHGQIISGEKPVLIENMAATPEVEGRFFQGDITEYQFLSFLGVPIRNRDGVAGALVLESFSSRKYSRPDLTILQVIGERTGVLLDWWRNYGIVRETAMRDGLTGLLNHRSFMERFDEEINRASRYQEHLVLLMLDLDKFKRVNDSYGHLYGDYVLEQTAQSLRMSVRNIDLVARYGGEEFAIILVNASKAGILQTTKRIVNNVANHEFNKDGISVRITISAGAAEFPSEGTTTRELIAKADEAMYEVKRRGGNDVSLTFNAAS